MPPFALSTFFTQAAESASTRTAHQSSQQGSHLLPSRFPLLGIGVSQRLERAMDNGIRHKRITVADISKPKLLYGTGPFAWNFAESGSWRLFDEDEKTLVQLENSQNPFILADDEDPEQSSGETGAENTVSPDGVDNIRTKVVSCSQPKAEHTLRPPAECIVDYRFCSSSGKDDFGQSRIAESGQNTDAELDASVGYVPTNSMPLDALYDTPPGNVRNNGLSAIISEIEKVANSCKELSAPGKEGVGEMEFDPYNNFDAGSTSSFQSREYYSPDGQFSPDDAVSTPVYAQREPLRTSQMYFMSTEDAQRILSERRFDIQRSPELRFVVPDPFTRDPRSFRRASAPVYPRYIPPRPESIEKLRRCLMKQFNAEDLYRPSIPSLLVPGSEFHRPKSIYRISRRLEKADDQYSDPPPPNTPPRRRLSDKLLVRVLRRAYYDALIMSTPIAPRAAFGVDPFADPVFAQSPSDGPRSAPQTSVPSLALPANESTQSESATLLPAEPPSSPKRKSSISTQLSSIRSSFKKRTSLGTISWSQVPSEEAKEGDLPPTSPSAQNADKGDSRIKIQIADSAAKCTSLRKGDAIPAQKSTWKPSDYAKRSFGKRRGLFDISNITSASTAQAEAPPTSEKYHYEKRSRKPVASLVLSENTSRHRRSLSIHSADFPLPPQAPPPAFVNSRSSIMLKRPFRA